MCFFREEQKRQKSTNGTTSSKKAFTQQRKSSNEIATTGWEKILTNDIFDKGLISQIHRKLTQLSIRKNIPFKKWA